LVAPYLKLADSPIKKRKNALNNIYSLSYLKPEKTPDNLLKLSEMLRYMLYECNEDKVPISKEIAYLENYIALKLLKDSRGMKVSVDLAPPTTNFLIAPMKTVDQKLIFKVSNSFALSPSTKDKVGGIGLTNVKRQLALLYPNKHRLDIQSNNNEYHVYLEIDVTT